MALKVLRLLIVRDQKVEVKDFGSYELLQKYASGEKGTVSNTSPSPAKPSQSKSLIGNSLREKVQNKKSADSSDDSK